MTVVNELKQALAYGKEPLPEEKEGKGDTKGNSEADKKSETKSEEEKEEKEKKEEKDSDEKGWWYRVIW